MIYNKEQIEKIFELLNEVAKKAHNEVKDVEAEYETIIRIGRFTSKSTEYPIKIDLKKDFFPKEGYGSQWRLKDFNDFDCLEIYDNIEQIISEKIKQAKKANNESIVEGALTIKKLEEYISS